MPFWLAISEEDIPRQSARGVGRDSNFQADHDAVARENDLAAPAEVSPSRNEIGPENRELLLNVLAETAVDRVCAKHGPPGPGLSKFRLKPTDSNLPADSPSDPSPPDELQPENAEVLERRASKDETRPPRMARYQESTPRPHLLLRLLSRF